MLTWACGVRTWADGPRSTTPSASCWRRARCLGRRENPTARASVRAPFESVHFSATLLLHSSATVLLHVSLVRMLPKANKHVMSIVGSYGHSKGVSWLSLCPPHNLACFPLSRPVNVRATLFDYHTCLSLVCCQSRRSNVIRNGTATEWYNEKGAHAWRAAVGCLCTFSHVTFDTVEGAFAIMLPIQLSTFLMTLVRKSIISGSQWHFWSVARTSPTCVQLFHAM